MRHGGEKLCLFLKKKTNEAVEIQQPKWGRMRHLLWPGKLIPFAPAPSIVQHIVQGRDQRLGTLQKVKYLTKGQDPEFGRVSGTEHPSAHLQTSILASLIDVLVNLVILMSPTKIIKGCSTVAISSNNIALAPRWCRIWLVRANSFDYIAIITENE